MRGRRENEGVQHKRDLEHAREECQRLRQEAAAALRRAADEAATGKLDIAMKHARAAADDVAAAQQACAHWKSLNPID